MATQTFEVVGPPGLTSVTGELYPVGSDTRQGGANVATAGTNNPSVYTFASTGTPAGDYRVVLKWSSTVVATSRFYVTGDTTATYRTEQMDLVNAPNTTALSAVAVAVRDIVNTSPAANSLGAGINTAVVNAGTAASIAAQAATDAAEAAASAAEAHTHSQTVEDRVGAFTGTGINTILGFLKALMSKVASTPSDVGGTYDATTDSTEAIRDRGDAAWVTGSTSITVPAAVAIASQSPSVIAAVRGDTLSRALPVMGTITGRSSLIFTVKRTLSDPDSKSLLQVSESGGLLLVDGVAPSSSSLGSLTVTNASTGAVTLAIDETIMAKMPVVNGLYWDCQFTNSGTITTPISGRFNISGDVTRATS